MTIEKEKAVIKLCGFSSGQQPSPTCSLLPVFPSSVESSPKTLKQSGESRALLLSLQSHSFPYNPSCPTLSLAEDLNCISESIVKR
jgi:hypothetical protein